MNTDKGIACYTYTYNIMQLCTLCVGWLYLLEMRACEEHTQIYTHTHIYTYIYIYIYIYIKVKKKSKLRPYFWSNRKEFTKIVYLLPYGA
jgi:hypothetical protein